ncbi:hypothetical protein HELRODRAFT_191310 [Helobdella robusta]|uniref:Protein kinase domain-containing protein n=1 Tax=Helobdella robusta TaxID=6412 RepID=T1FSV5_HELRO|nr:hypothetical protein HELRODRAFT_191310 [Helobdella robusta]ESO05490.1 hypothetical protein HELRODRAFT_191310 [Helobdella robusta]
MLRKLPGHFQIDDSFHILGQGAFGAVFLGHDNRTQNCKVAIKMAQKKGFTDKQLLKERKILEDLKSAAHKNLVAFLSFEEIPDYFAFITEYCNGGDFESFMRAMMPIHNDTIAMFLRHMSQGMQALSSHNIVHRDLKPANILIHHGPSESVFKIADFGFARVLNEGFMAATICGSPSYMAPEIHLNSRYDFKADLWSIGVITHQCMTGKLPFQFKTQEELRWFFRHREINIEFPEIANSDLKDLISGLLVKRPRDRMNFDQFLEHPFLQFGTKSDKGFVIPEQMEEQRRIKLKKSLQKGGEDLKKEEESEDDDEVFMKDFEMVNADQIDEIPSQSLPRTSTVARPSVMGALKYIGGLPMQNLNKLLQYASIVAPAKTTPSVTKNNRIRSEVKFMMTGSSSFSSLSSGSSDNLHDTGNRQPRRHYQQRQQEKQLQLLEQKEKRHHQRLLHSRSLMTKEQIEFIDKLDFLVQVGFCMRKVADDGCRLGEEEENRLRARRGSDVELCVQAQGRFLQQSKSMSALHVASQHQKEQLVLYMRALEILHEGIESAKTAHGGKRFDGVGLQNVLDNLIFCYQECHNATNRLKQKTPVDRTINVEKVLYRHSLTAIDNSVRIAKYGPSEMCMEELKLAYILLHWIECMAILEPDKRIVRRIKHEVEAKIRELDMEGFVYL